MSMKYVTDWSKEKEGTAYSSHSLWPRLFILVKTGAAGQKWKWRDEEEIYFATSLYLDAYFAVWTVKDIKDTIAG